MASELSQPALVRVASVFERAFGGRPTAVGRAPGRVNLIGDHVDYAEGFAMPIAINRDAVAAVREAPDGRWRVASGEMPVQVELPDPLSASPIVDQRERWANFVLGVLVAVANEGIRVPPLQVAVSSDVPMGGGLASSAALEASVAIAVCEVVAAPFFGLPLARLCQEAEHRFAGVPCGLMDQVTTIMARAGQALLIDCRTLDCRYVPLPPQAAVLVVDTGVRHDLSDGRYAERRAQVEEAARILGLRALRDADETLVRNARIPEPVAARARHVVRETQRTLLAANALRRGDLELLGMLMYQSHQSLREDFAVSVPELDAIVDEARAAGVGQGILGARMTGGGFGGSAVVLVDAAHVDAATARIVGAFSRRFRRQPTVRRVEAAAGAGLVRQVAAL